MLYQILGASFVDAQDGWLLGDLGCPRCPLAVRTTSDGGLTWHALSNLNAGLLDGQNPRFVHHLTFATRTDGWAWGNGLFVTHDGGVSWADETRPDQIVADLQVIQGVAWRLDRTGTCSPGAPACIWTLQVSQDGGRSWQPGAEQPLTTIPAMAATLAVRSPPEAWIDAWSLGSTQGSPPARLLVSRDAGASWQERPHPCAAIGGSWREAFALSLDGQQLWLICGGQPGAGQQQKHLFVSADDGQHWSERGMLVSSGYVGPLVALTAGRAFWGESRGGGHVLGTRDGGRTWQSVLYEPEDRDSLTAPLSFADSQHGWVISTVALWRTTDGGESWQRTVP